MTNGSLLIHQPRLCVTMNDRREEFQGGHIYVEDGKIRSLGPEPFEGTADEVVDASRAVVLPGWINTHHHLFQTLTRNLPRMQDAPLFPWLKHHYLIWRELDEEAVDVSTRTGVAELLLSGVTTTSDHLYLFPRSASPQLIDVEIAAARDLGIRFHPTRGSMSLGESRGGLPPDDVVQTETEIREDTLRLLHTYHDPQPGALVRIALAPCSPFSVTEDLMRETVHLAREADCQIHTHLAETLDEEAFCVQTFGKRPLDYAQDLGWVNRRAWFAHAIHLNPDEIQRLGAVGAGMSHCPSSNLRLGSGIAPIRDMLSAGMNVSLGVDGSASNDAGNMLVEMRTALFLSRLRHPSHWLTAREVVWMATRGGAAVLGRDDIGQLAVGKEADLILYRLDRLEYAGGLEDPLAALLFGVRMAPVDDLWVQGRRIVRQGTLDIDLARLVDRHNATAARLLRQAEDRTGLSFTEKEA